MENNSIAIAKIPVSQTLLVQVDSSKACLMPVLMETGAESLIITFFEYFPFLRP